MSKWGISSHAAELHRDALVWDMTLPIIMPGESKRGLSPFSVRQYASQGSDQRKY